MRGRARQDPRQDPEGKKVIKVLDISGPPTAVRPRQTDWCKWWFLALLMWIPTFFYVQSLIYSVTLVTWDASQKQINFEADTAGCDMIIEQKDVKKSVARLSYWKSFGKGSLTLNGDTLHLGAVMMKKEMSYRCILRLTLQKQSGPHFGNVDISMDPDANAEAVAPPSNVDEIVALRVSGMKAAGKVTFLLNEAVDSIVSGVSADHLRIEIGSGKLSVIESPDQDTELAKSMYVKAKDAVFTVSVHTAPIHLTIDDHSMETASLAASSIAEGVGYSYALDPGSSSEPPIKLTIEAARSATYLFVADDEHMKPDAKLEKKLGEMVKLGPSLLPHGKSVAQKLVKWLKENTDEKFMIYFNFVAPNAPAGTTRLMSTPAYRAFSLEWFSMLSAGMLTPTIHRIETPVIGFDYLWPHREEKLTATEEYDYSMGIFKAIAHEVNINAIGIPNAKWTWDPPGPVCYVYDYIPDRHHKNRGGWQQRKLGYEDTGPFLIATSITLALGLIIGIIVSSFLVYSFRPYIHRRLRATSLYNANSYRLIYDEWDTDWQCTAGHVHWPKAGVLLRWQTRKNLSAVSTMTFEGRSWPGGKTHVAIEKVNPWRLPDHPTVRGQQVFLFGSEPVAKPTPEVHIDKFDQCLWGTWCLCAGGKRLPPGTPFCFRIVSLNAAGRTLEKSGWTRPVMIEERSSFAAYPLLIWKYFFSVLPEDTFQHFLDVHCLPIGPDHAQSIEFTDIKLALVNDSDLFCGAFDTTYGDEFNESLTQNVRLVVSTGGDIQTSDDDLYVTTKGAILPTNSSPDRQGSKLMDYKRALGDVDTPSLTLSSKKFIKIDMEAEAADGVLKCSVNEDIDQIVRFDVQVETGITNFTVSDNTARFETTWGELLELLHHKHTGYLDQLVLRDGMAPVAALTAKFNFSNHEFGKHKPGAAEYSGGFPNKVFSRLSPGQVFQWGSVITLVWEWQDVPGWDTFDLVMESEPLYGHSRHNVPEAKWVPKKMKETMLLKAVRGKDGSASIAMAPEQPYECNSMMCRILLRHPDPANHTVIAKGPELLIDRPVTLGDLELAYCAYCVRNHIPMLAIPKQQIKMHGIRLLEREFYVVRGYRGPLTTPIEMKFVAGDKGMDSLIKNAGSDLITNGKTMNVEDTVKEAELKAAGSTPGAQPAAASAPKERPSISILPKRGFMDVPTNVFWKRGVSWNEELLLWYSLAPSVSQEGYISASLLEYNANRLAKCANVISYLMRVILRVFVYLMQMIFLLLPVFIAFWLALRHDDLESKLLPNFHAEPHVDRVYMTDFAMYPSFEKSRWVLLEPSDHWAVRILLVYIVVVGIATLYTNFLHWYVKSNFIFEFFNYTLMIFWMGFVFLLVVYVSLMAVWVILGAMINPFLIPIALAIIGVIIIVRTQWSNLKMAKDTVEGIVYTRLDLALHAIMEVFVGPANSDAWMDMQTQKNDAGQICEIIRDSERDIMKKLCDQSTINTGEDAKKQLDQDYIDRYKLLRESAMFKQCLEGCPANEILATDFVPAETLPLAQEIANFNADIYNKRSFNTAPPYQAWDAPYTHHALSKALAMRAESFVPPPGQISKAEQVELDEISKDMHLSKETCTVIFKAFMLSLHLAKTSEEAALKSPWTIGPMMASVRKNQLFTHFIAPEEGKASTAQKYMIESQQSEMEKYDAIIANALTKIVDWQAIGRTIMSFAETTLYKVYCTRAVENELNPCLDGSSAFQVMSKAYDLCYENWDDYKKTPNKMFVDLGLITEEFAKNPATQKVMSGELDLCRYFDGSFDQQSLINAVKHMILEREEGPNAPEFPDPMYLWYGALKRILKDLGWADEEMEETWLAGAWSDVTEGIGFFRYRDVREVNQLVQALADDGLWKAAVKCLMKTTQIYGYAPCDPLTLGTDEARKQAHTLEYADMTNLKWINENCNWPVMIELDIWKKHARKSHFDVGPKTPIFLPLFQADDFLMDVVYGKEADPKDAKRDFVPLYAYPDDPMDLVWLLGDDGLIWHDLPMGKRPLRGIWLELYLKFSDTSSTLPSDLDVFYDCIEWQQKKHSVQTPWLRHNLLRRWILDVYIPRNTQTISCPTFMVLLQKLRVTLPEDVVKTEIFTPCPLVPGDDLGELRYINDLGCALRLWMGYGLWQEGIEELVVQLLPRGPIRTLALKILPAEFDIMDETNGSNGIVQPAQAVVLMHKLAHPGLTAEDLALTVQENLSIDCPERQIHHYFALLDVNGDGVMGVGEFIPTVRLIMTDYFPRQLMEHLNLTTFQIVVFILLVVLAVVFLLLCIALVIKTFTDGKGVASAIQSGFNACTVAFAHVQANASGGFNDSVSNVRAWLHSVVFDAIAAVLGLSKPVVDKFAGLLNDSTKKV